jgi:predicted nucleic acid-binding protein
VEQPPVQQRTGEYHAQPDSSDRQQLLTETSTHRSAGPVDLLIAATAERERLTVLCDDHDFQTVAAVTGQPVKLVTDV